MPRHTTPQILLEYYRWVDHGPPRICHTCEHYDLQGVCQLYQMEPPEDFAATQDACADYKPDVPF